MKYRNSHSGLALLHRCAKQLRVAHAARTTNTQKQQFSFDILVSVDWLCKITCKFQETHKICGSLGKAELIMRARLGRHALALCLMLDNVLKFCFPITYVEEFF